MKRGSYYVTVHLELVVQSTEPDMIPPLKRRRTLLVSGSTHVERLWIYPRYNDDDPRVPVFFRINSTSEEGTCSIRAFQTSKNKTLVVEVKLYEDVKRQDELIVNH